MRIPAPWGCPLGGAPAAATAASYTGTPAAVQSLPFLFPLLPLVTMESQAQAHPLQHYPLSPEDLKGPAPSPGKKGLP